MNKYSVGLCFTVLLLSSTLYGGTPILDIIGKALDIISIMIVILTFPVTIRSVSHYKNFLFSVVFLFGYLLINSYAHGMTSGIYPLFMMFVRSIAYCLILGSLINEDSEVIFRIILKSTLVLGVINLLAMPLMKEHTYLLAGNRNGFPVLFMPGILSGYICSFISPKNKLYYIFLLMVALTTVCIAGSATSIVGIFIVTVYYLIFNRIKIVQKSAYKLLFIGTCIFIVLVVLKGITNSPLLQNFVESIGKDLTFSGRAYVWAEAMDIISGSLLLGVGFYWNSGLLDVIIAHNIILDFLLSGGLVFLLFIVMLTILLVRYIKKKIITPVYCGVMLIFVVYVLMLQFEVYIYTSLVLFLFIIFSTSHAKGILTNAE